MNDRNIHHRREDISLEVDILCGRRRATGISFVIKQDHRELGLKCPRRHDPTSPNNSLRVMLPCLITRNCHGYPRRIGVRQRSSARIAWILPRRWDDPKVLIFGDDAEEEGRRRPVTGPNAIRHEPLEEPATIVAQRQAVVDPQAAGNHAQRYSPG